MSVYSSLSFTCWEAYVLKILMPKYCSLIIDSSVVIGMECDCFPQAMVSCQMLSELEEVIQYKLVPERREIIRQIWWERLQVHLCKDQGWRG